MTAIPFPATGAALARALAALPLHGRRAARHSGTEFTIQATPFPPHSLQLSILPAPDVKLPQPRGAVVLLDEASSVVAAAPLEQSGAAFFPTVPAEPLRATWRAALPQEKAARPISPPLHPSASLAAAPLEKWLPADTGHRQFLADFFPADAGARVVISSPALAEARVRFRVGGEWASATLHGGRGEIMLHGAHADFDGLLEDFTVETEPPP